MEQTYRIGDKVQNNFASRQQVGGWRGKVAEVQKAANTPDGYCYIIYGHWDRDPCGTVEARRMTVDTMEKDV